MHQFTIHAPDEPLLAWADPAALGHVLSNLLTNAVKYSPGGGTISVELAGDEAVADDGAVVRVRDQGIGIAPEHVGRIFERFYRVPSQVRPTFRNPHTARQSGAGLGLAVCKAIVEAHGGRMWVESEPGQGSTFSFTVPLAGGGEGD